MDTEEAGMKRTKVHASLGKRTKGFSQEIIEEYDYGFMLIQVDMTITLKHLNLQ